MQEAYQINFDYIMIQNPNNSLENFDSSKISWLKSGGKIQKLLKINKEDQLELLSTESNPIFNILPIGNFSNLLIKDRGYQGTAVKLTGNFSKITANKDYLLVGAGVLDNFFSQYCYRYKISGYEFLYTIMYI